jgi:glutamate formiminotransferase
LRAVQAVGWWLEEANMAQVSMNLIDHDVTPIHVAYEEVCKAATALKLPVVGSEIVGLVPLTALLQVCTSQYARAPAPSDSAVRLGTMSPHLGTRANLRFCFI